MTIYLVVPAFHLRRWPASCGVALLHPPGHHPRRRAAMTSSTWSSTKPPPGPSRSDRRHAELGRGYSIRVHLFFQNAAQLMSATRGSTSSSWERRPTSSSARTTGHLRRDQQASGSQTVSPTVGRRRRRPQHLMRGPGVSGPRGTETATVVRRKPLNPSRAGRRLRPRRGHVRPRHRRADPVVDHPLLRTDSPPARPERAWLR